MSEELNNEFPWLIFSIHEEIFAVNSKHVASIVHKNEEVVFVPHEHDYIKGLITFRGKPIKLINTRRLLNEKSVEDEMNAFNEMIDQRKEDHIRWVNELERCAKCSENFTLATDPHKCAFGKWYDNFETDMLTIKFHMGKIEEPHRLLHEAAEKYNNCSRDCEHCDREECLKVTVEKAKNTYVREVLEILEEAKIVFKDYFKEMIIAVESGNDTFGFLVDEVIAVEELDIMGDFSENKTIFRSKFFNGVAKRKKDDKLIILMNINEMLKLQEDVEITHKQLLSLAGKSENTGAKENDSISKNAIEGLNEQVQTDIINNEDNNADSEEIKTALDESIISLDCADGINTIEAELQIDNELIETEVAEILPVEDVSSDIEALSETDIPYQDSIEIKD